MNKYLAGDLSLESNFRAIYLFGRNVATYKFALAKSLLELTKQDKTYIALEELSPYYAKYLLEHIKGGKRQITSSSSKFISTLELYNSEQITYEQLLFVTEHSGFNNVIDAFHNLPFSDINHNFFVKEKQGRTAGIKLTDHIFQLVERTQSEDLFNEIEGRWNLVESAWTEKKPKIDVEFDQELETLFYIKKMTPQKFLSSHERVNLTPVRNPLNGYQKGKCFYCFKEISIVSNLPNTCDVDHFIPLSLQYNNNIDLDLNGVWNLVLACAECNRGAEHGKYAQVPHKSLLDRLFKRNEYLIESSHPLSGTIKMKTGNTPKERAKYLEEVHNFASRNKKAFWLPKRYYATGF